MALLSQSSSSHNLVFLWPLPDATEKVNDAKASIFCVSLIRLLVNRNCPRTWSIEFSIISVNIAYSEIFSVSSHTSSTNGSCRGLAFSGVLEQGVSFTACFYLAMIWSLVPSLPSFNLIKCPLYKVLYFRHAKEADIGRAEMLLLSHFWKSSPLEFILRQKSHRGKTKEASKGYRIPKASSIHQCVSTNYLLSAGALGSNTYQQWVQGLQSTLLHCRVGCSEISPLILGLRKFFNLSHGFNFTPLFKNKATLKVICVLQITNKFTRHNRDAEVALIGKLLFKEDWSWLQSSSHFSSVLSASLSSSHLSTW